MKSTYCDEMIVTTTRQRRKTSRAVTASELGNRSIEVLPEPFIRAQRVKNAHTYSD